jgi:hypothetical protein
MFTMDTRTRFKIIDLKVRGAISYFGMLMKNGIVNVYTTNNEADYH